MNFATIAAAPPPSAQDAGWDALLWVGILIGLCMIAGAAILVLRRYVFSSASIESSGAILDSLRAMRDRGDMSQAEYDRARRSFVQRTQGSAPPAPTRPQDRVRRK